MVASDGFFATHTEQLAALTVRHVVPAIHQSRDFSIAGGLMSYGGNFVESHRQTGVYAVPILKDENPAELPVQLVTKVELFINLKTGQNPWRHRAASTARPRRRGDQMNGAQELRPTAPHPGCRDVVCFELDLARS